MPRLVTEWGRPPTRQIQLRPARFSCRDGPAAFHPELPLFQLFESRRGGAPRPTALCCVSARACQSARSRPCVLSSARCAKVKIGATRSCEPDCRGAGEPKSPSAKRCSIGGFRSGETIHIERRRSASSASAWPSRIELPPTGSSARDGAQVETLHRLHRLRQLTAMRSRFPRECALVSGRLLLRKLNASRPPESRPSHF